jgi:hypothetical protein
MVRLGGFMGDRVVSDCRPVPSEESLLAGAMYDYGQPAERGHWPFNVLSRHALVYDCGLVALPDGPLQHRHSQEELDLCRRLSGEAAERMQGVDLVRTTATVSPLGAFFMAANVDAPLVTAVSAPEVRRAFGGAIYPPTGIRVEPLRVGEGWWKDLLDYYASSDPPEREQGLRPWRDLIAWFADRAEVTEPSFVSIGEECLPDWEGQENPACTFPRLVVGRTAAGSLVGLYGAVVQA